MSDVQVRRVSLTFAVVGLKIANAIDANTAAIKESAK